MFRRQLIHLLGGETSVREHANLAGNMRPVVLRAELLQVVLEQGTHLDDAVGHALDLSQPLLIELWVVQDLSRDASTVDGGVRVEGADQDLDLRVHTLLLLGRLADNGESTSTLTVETHVLGERLGQARVVALLNKVAQREGVLVGVTASEALVGHIEEDVVVALLDGGLNSLPLLRGRIDTSRVVGTGVQEENAALGGGLDVGDQTLKVETDGVLVVVSVLFDLETRVLEDSGVVGPGGSRDVDGLVAWVVAGEEVTADAQGTGAGNGLGDGDAVEGGAILAVGELGSRVDKLGDTGDAGILLVQAGGNNLVLSLAYGRQDVWLSLVISVSSDTCV